MQVPGHVQKGQKVMEKVPEKVQSRGRFNRVLETVEEGLGNILKKVLEKIPGRFGRLNQVPARFGHVERIAVKIPEKVWPVLVQSQVMFNCVPEKVPPRVPGRFGAEPDQVQQGSREGSGEGCGESLGGFGAEAGQVQPIASREGSEEGPEGFGALVQNHVKFERAPEKVPEKVLEEVWTALVQPGPVCQGSGGSRRRSWKPWCRFR